MRCVFFAAVLTPWSRCERCDWTPPDRAVRNTPSVLAELCSSGVSVSFYFTIITVTRFRKSCHVSSGVNTGSVKTVSTHSGPLPTQLIDGKVASYHSGNWPIHAIRPKVCGHQRTRPVCVMMCSCGWRSIITAKVEHLNINEPGFGMGFQNSGVHILSAI